MTPKRARILYISLDGMTDALGQSQVLAYLRVMARQGYHYELLSYEKPEAYAKGKADVEAQLQGLPIHWHPLPYTYSPPILSTLKDLRAGWRKLQELQAQAPFDIVHSRSYLPALLGRRMQRRYGTRFIFDMRGWWPDQRKESGAWNSPLYAPIYRFFKKKEKEFFEKSDITVSLTYAGRDEIVRLGYRQADSIMVVPTCVDFDAFPPRDNADAAALRAQLGIAPDAWVLVNSGSLGGNYPVKELLDIFAGLLLRQPRAHLLLLTKTPPDEARQACQAYGLDTARVTVTSVAHHQVHRYLAVADAGMFVYRPLYSSLGSSPTKLAEYWACGLPMLTTSGVGDVDRIIAEHPGSGVSMPLGLPPADMAPYLDQLLALNTPADTLRGYATDYYSLHEGCRRYMAEYDKLLALR